MSIALGFTRDFDEASDIVQDACIKAYLALVCGKYKDDLKFGAWMARIVTNVATDWFRRKQRYPHMSAEFVFDTLEGLTFGSVESAEDAQMREDRLDELHGHIATLSLEQQRVLQLRLNELSFKEITMLIGNVSVNTILGRNRYAIIRLRKKMGITTVKKRKKAVV